MSSTYHPTRFTPPPAWSAPVAGRHRPRQRAIEAPPPGALAALVDVFDQAVPPDADPVAFAVSQTGGDGRIALRLLDDGDLLGWRAPDDVVALGVVASGRAHRLDSSGEAGYGPGAGGAGDPDGAGDAVPGDAGDTDGGARAGVTHGGEADGGEADGGAGGPVRVVVAVGRDGDVAGRCTLDGRIVEEPPAAGRLFDTLRRALGLPTDPPPCTTLPLVTNLWLSAMLLEADRLGRPLDWPEALRLHPAGTILADDPAAMILAGDRIGSTAALAAVVDRTAELWDWETTRRVAAHHDCLDELCPSELAGWMDEGMFARWILDELLPLPALTERVAGVLTPAAAEAVGRVLHPDGPG